MFIPDSCKERWWVRWSWASGVAEVWAADGRPEGDPVEAVEPYWLLTWVAWNHGASWVGQKVAWAVTLVGSSLVGEGQPLETKGVETS